MAETVLVCTLGAAPQVITLALDALLHRGETIRRVDVIHTDPALDPVRQALRELQIAFSQSSIYPKELLLVPHVLAGRDGPLVDVTTPNEIDSAFQSLYTLLRQHKQSGRIIHLCIAGGRKTITLFAMAAAQILLEPPDQVWHLISDHDLITSGKFHASSPSLTKLIPIPIAHWGYLRSASQSRADTFINTLTPAERELIMLLIRYGASNAGLANELGKSEKTIANQLSSIYQKLQRHFDLDTKPDRTTLMALLGRFS